MKMRTQSKFKSNFIFGWYKITGGAFDFFSLAPHFPFSLSFEFDEIFIPPIFVYDK